MPELISADGTTIAYEIHGTGPAVVLVDGALCHREAGPMRPLAEVLSPSVTVVLYDRRGRGGSGDAMPYALEREVEDLAALIEAAGGAAALFGLSSGGGLALHATALLGPARATKLAVFEPPYLPEPMRATADDYTAALTTTLAEGRRGDAVALFLRRVGLPVEAVEGMRRSPGWPANEAVAPTLAYDAAAMGDNAVPAEVAAAVRVPTLALAGEASPPFLRYGAEQVASAVPGARLELVSGAGHDASAAALAHHLVPFLTG